MWKEEEKVRRISELMSCFTVMVFLFSCASKPIAPAVYSYEEKAITVHLKADPQLNLYQDLSHTILLCIYQLRDPNAFNQLREDYSGLTKLLECEPFDASVVSTKRVFVQPNEESTLDLDRGEGAKYVGVVAGYYQLQKENASLVRQIQEKEYTRGWFRKTTVRKVDKLNMDLFLGPQTMQELGGK